MKPKILIGILLFLIVVNVATIGSFFYFRMQHRPPLDERAPLGALLSTEKRERLHTLMRGFQEEIHPIRQELQVNEKELYQLLISESPDREMIDQKMNDISRLREEIAQKAIDRMLVAKEFMSEKEQKIFFQHLLENRMGPREFGKQRFRGKQPPPFMRERDNPPPRDN